VRDYLSAYILGIFLGIALVSSVWLIFDYQITWGWVSSLAPGEWGIRGEVACTGAVVGCLITTILLIWLELSRA